MGKTACLIHIAFDKIFRRQKLIHVSLDEGPEKVSSYYQVIYSDLVKALEIKEDYEYRALVDRNRVILAYIKQSFDLNRLRENLVNLEEHVGFKADALIVDGIRFENTERALFEGFKTLAEELEVEIWFSALSHRHITEVNERGIPYPCHKVDDLFNVIIHLQPEASGVYLKLLKDHETYAIDGASVRLDPHTFLAIY